MFDDDESTHLRGGDNMKQGFFSHLPNAPLLPDYNEAKIARGVNDQRKERKGFQS
jgi:hypothetical protein